MCRAPALFLCFVPATSYAAGLSGGIAAGRELATLALAWVLVGLLAGLLVAYLLYKKASKGWVWSMVPVIAVGTFFALWAFSIGQYSEPMLALINALFDTSY